MKKTLAVILSVILVFSAIPLSIMGAAVTDNSQQIIAQGGNSSTPDERIKISKSVSASEKENYFDITLSVTQELPATDIVLVMDISNSMNSNHSGNSTSVESEKRLYKAKNAAKAFLEEYSKTTGICKNRRIGMVQFNTNASVVFELGNVNDNLTDYTNKISAIIAPNDENRFTNIEGGLKLAANMLESSTAKQKYIVLITDGFPTTYIEAGRNSTSYISGWDVTRTEKNPPSPKPTKPADGLFWDFVKNIACSGTSYSDTAAIKARTVATEIKNSGINIYSIGVDVSSESQTIQRYIDRGNSSGISIVERTGKTYEIGSATDSTAYVNWLGTKIGGGDDLEKAGVTKAFSQGDTVDQLNTAFDTVLSYILGSEPVSVTDPMGENIEFLGFYDKNGSLAGNILNGSHIESGENTAAFTNEINWDINASGYSETKTSSATVRTYNLKYRVRLTNEAADFIGEKSYNTNARTVLNYVFLDHTDKELEFVVPSVEGYLGSFSVNKIDESMGAGLDGAKFELIHNHDCSVCGGKVAISAFDAETLSGNAVFTSIPSGHEYTLSEVSAPDGYVLKSRTYSVEVAYGETSVDGKKISSAYTVTNKAYVPAEINLKGSKTLSGGDKTDAGILAGQFSFNVAKDNSRGVSGVPSKVETEAGGLIDFGVWSFSIPGIYSFVITENNLGNAGYDYDGSSYTVKVTASVDNSGEKLTASTEILKNGAAADEIVFSNTYTAPQAITADPLDGKITLTENGNPKDIEDKQFSVSINADPSNDPSGWEADIPTDSSVNSDGEFDIPDISFKKPGTYSFVVSQDNKEAEGYGYDNSEYIITYTVTLDESTNTLVISDKVITKNDTPADDIVFNNTYTTPDPVELPVTGVTTLTGGGKTNSDISDGFFTYTVSGGDQNGVSDVPDSTEAEAGGPLDFGTWKFSEEGTYTFTVNENTPPAGYTDETGEVTVTVTVTLNKSTNKFEANAVYSSGETIKIDNTYVAPDPVSAVIDGSKLLTENGEEIEIAENRFSASISADESNDSNGYVFTAECVNIGTNGKFKFSEISFLKAGTYVFNVTEDNKGAAGYHYDSSVYSVEYTIVLDTATNELVIAETEISKDGEPVDGIVFRNIYDTPAPAQLPVDGITTLTGGGKTNDDITEDLFSYKIDGGEQDNVFDVPSEISTKAYGELDFGTWSFTEEGVYTFTVNENTPPAGYTDETGDVTVTVTVTLNETTNKLEAQAVFSTGEQIKIDNTYVAPDPITVSLNGTKTLTGQKSDSDITAGDFTFAVKADESNDSEGFEGFEETASVQDGGAIDFGTATFTKHGVYKFTISENNLGKTGYTYDSSICYVTVTVTLDESTNTLSSAVEIIRDGASAEAIEFENVYIPVPVSDELVFSKNIIGIPLLSSDFTFVLKADNSSYPMPTGSESGEITAKVSGEGEAAFGKITFTEPGIYSYTVSELNEKTLGYIYDRTVYEVVYTVTDDNGMLVAERIIKTDGEIVDETVFNNVYIPPIIPIIPIIPIVPVIPIIPDVDIPGIDIPDFPSDDENPPESDSDNNTDAENSEDEKAETDVNIPHTGSEFSLTFIMAFIGFALSVYALLFFRKKRFE
ncbi:MAG: VWA domain-containing protein [Clostridia bacterium]|nr:VWA domain-containing protein [Clostridia bacterium]